MINAAKVDLVMSLYAAVARGKRGGFVRACDVPSMVRPGEIQVVDVDPAAVVARLQHEIHLIHSLTRGYHQRYEAEDEPTDTAKSVKKSAHHEKRFAQGRTPICCRCLDELVMIDGTEDDPRMTCKRCGGRYR